MLLGQMLKFKSFDTLCQEETLNTKVKAVFRLTDIFFQQRCHCEIASKQGLPIFSNEQGSTISQATTVIASAAKQSAKFSQSLLSKRQSAQLGRLLRRCAPRNDSFGLAKSSAKA